VRATSASYRMSPGFLGRASRGSPISYLLNGSVRRLNEYRTTFSARPGTGRYRSREDRFGGRLLEVGFDDIRLLVSRPPRTLEAVLPIAAEHCAFSDDAHRSWRRIAGIARRGGQPVPGLLAGLTPALGGENHAAVPRRGVAAVTCRCPMAPGAGLTVHVLVRDASLLMPPGGEGATLTEAPSPASPARMTGSGSRQRRLS
jgi:hypothetical protein